jgi:hypothetical protein
MGKELRIIQIMPGGGWLIERASWGPGDEIYSSPNPSSRGHSGKTAS